MTTLKLVDNYEITVNDEYMQVDDIMEYTGYCADYDELKEISSKLTNENMKKIQCTSVSNVNYEYNDMTCASPKIYIVSDNGNIEFTIRLKKKTEEDEAEEAMQTAIQLFDDSNALNCKSLYPDYNSLIGKSVEKDFKLVYYNTLYKTAQATTISKEYVPGAVGTESIYTRIDEEHKGTSEDPIPYFGNQILEKGKIYIDDENTLWICTNGSGIAIFDRLINLQTFVALYYDAQGTAGDPIIYAGGLALEVGKYYTQNNVIYKCIRATEIPIYNDLKDVVGNYVEVYNPYEIPIEPEPEQDGTLEHPYIWTNSNIVEVGKYYTQDDVIYVGIRDSEIELYNDLKDLVDNYVKVYKPEPTEEPEEPETPDKEEGDGEEETPAAPDGSKDHPFEWNNNMEIKNGLYYTEDGVLYVGTRDSGIPLVHDLKDLVNLYVSVVEE